MEGINKPGSVPLYGMVIDAARCIGCYNCFLACRDEHVGNAYQGLTAAQPESGQHWMRIEVQERGTFPKVKAGYVPIPCLQCADASCISAATGDAVYRRADGIVVIDPEKAIGQRHLVSSCPYGAISWNEASNLPQKCTFCAHRLGGANEPRCVEACPNGALIFGNLNDPASKVSQAFEGGGIEDLRPEIGMRPAVRYRALPTRFVVGEVVFADLREVPAVAVSVTLHRNGQELRAVTDSFGDFEFSGLVSDTSYALKVEHPGYRSHELAVHTPTDLNLGAIVLEAL